MLSELTIVYLHLLLNADLRDRLPSVTDWWAGFAEEMEAFPGRREKLMHAWGRAPFEWSSRWETGLRFIEGVRAGPPPALHYLHFMLPHQHFEYLPSGRRYKTVRGVPGLTGDGREGYWTAIVPEKALRKGRNNLEVLVITRVDTQTRLAWGKGDPQDACER